jgi:hypothetical protein
MTKADAADKTQLAELVAEAQGWTKKTETYPGWYSNGQFRRLVSSYRPDKDVGLAMKLFDQIEINQSLEFKMTKQSDRWIVILLTPGCVVSSEGETLSVALCRAFVNASKAAVGGRGDLNSHRRLKFINQEDLQKKGT